MKYVSVMIIFGLLSCQPQVVDSPYIPDSDLWNNYPAAKTKKNKHVLLISGDEEYRSEEALPQLAKILSQQHGIDCTVLFAQDPEHPSIIDPNYSSNIPGLEHLKSTDLMILFTRFRSLPAAQMSHINQYLKRGKPVLAIRTATHAFNYADSTHQYAHYGWNYDGSKSDWAMGFGKRILGETWYTHHGHHKHQSTRGILNPELADHPILRGISDQSIWGSTDVYGIRMPLGDEAVTLLYGQSIDRSGEYDETDILYGMRESDTTLSTETYANNNTISYNPNTEMPPIAWLNSYQLDGGVKGTSFTSTIGSSTDLLDTEVRRLLINATYHLLDLEVPNMAEVRLMGNYSPSAYQFHSNEYWDEKGLKVDEAR